MYNIFFAIPKSATYFLENKHLMIPTNTPWSQLENHLHHADTKLPSPGHDD